MSGNEITETPCRRTTSSTREVLDKNCVRDAESDHVGPRPECSTDCAAVANVLPVDTEQETATNTDNEPH